MGEVFAARDERLARTVAITLLPPELSADPGRRARCEREARTLAALSHPAIVTIVVRGQGQVRARGGVVPGGGARAAEERRQERQ